VAIHVPLQGYQAMLWNNFMFYDSGSIELQKKLRLAQPSEAVIIQSLGGLLHKNIRLLFTWCTQDIAVLNHLRANEDGDTIAGYNSTKRDREDDFLKYHYAKLVWGINEFKDALHATTILMLLPLRSCYHQSTTIPLKMIIMSHWIRLLSVMQASS
jgi:hypothetical protein